MLVSTAFLHQNRPQYGLLVAFVGLMIIAYAWEIIVILPGHFFLMRAKNGSLIDYLLLGFLGFALPLLAFMIYKSTAMVGREIILASYWGILGSSATWLFWLLRKPVTHSQS